jgi:bifunctional DNA-binding transcriptional regulator/antitoxin component of YhaV-PrlF toxin-antitoxin module
VNDFTLRKNNSASFISRIDKKGRALISSTIRKKLLLRYGSVVRITIAGKMFISKIDERGRFGVPKDVRGDALQVQGEVSVFSFSNGRCGVMLTSEPVELKTRVKISVAAPFLKSRRCLG